MELQALSPWRCVEFISDLHLHASDMATFGAWSNYMRGSSADAIFILGDLFEVWVGDDCLDHANVFEQACVGVLRDAARKRPLYIMQGNRDFLMGPQLMAACSAQLLDDPTVFTFGGERWLLTHGDALCLDDTDYMAFRTVVRSPAWQTAFLHKPLDERIELARAMRAQSEARKHSDVPYADVDSSATVTSLQHHAAHHMIHGHTHRPADHCLQGGRDRRVLSDWDLQAQPPRAEVLRLSIDGSKSARSAPSPVHVERLSPAMATTKPLD
jgi:UDP-2,3-diacylglucosamine hydrolase